ncbi:hypothetical protein SNE40_011770 [Patella caerulea]|uniref:Phosphatidic acid phosphatase type 2/haloperoxidase domain-containing protein n=1 Tax=Patella caerulea TaxID=87958 RepID=A0AAN8JK43_PATCE
MAELSLSGYSRRSSGFKSVLFSVTAFLELLLVTSVIVLEYFLRWTEVFPLRRAVFSCTDPSIGCTTKDAELLSDFAFSARVPSEVIYALSFSIPPFIIFIGEIGLYTFTTEPQKTIRIISKQCVIPQVVRRLIRFIGVFVFGGFTLMVFVDIVKIMVGRLRPDFLEVCQLTNKSMCTSLYPGGEPYGTHDLCQNTNRLQLRQARTSFPSMNSALTAYAAFYIGIYIHGAMRSHTVRIIRPFISLVFVMFSLLCGLAEVGLCLSHWTDTVIGFCMGVILAFYLGFAVLNNFREHLSQEKLIELLNNYVADSYFNYDDGYNWLKPEPVTSIRIPRAQVYRTSSDETDVKYRRPRLKHSTFQHDRHNSLDRYRRNSGGVGAASHM